MDFVNMTNATTQDKVLLMLMERIENLEKELYEEKKANIIRNIASCCDKDSICIDIFMFLLGIDVKTRIKIKDNHKLIKNYIPSQIPKRAIELYKIQNTLNIPFWELDFDIDNLYPSGYGNNIYQVLQNMTLQELNDYWNYRILWTKWLEI